MSDCFVVVIWRVSYLNCAGRLTDCIDHFEECVQLSEVCATSHLLAHIERILGIDGVDDFKVAAQASDFGHDRLDFAVEFVVTANGAKEGSAPLANLVRQLDLNKI